MDEPVVVEANINFEDYKKSSWFKYFRIGRYIWPSLLLFIAIPLSCAVLTLIMIFNHVLSSFFWIHVVFWSFFPFLMLFVRGLTIRSVYRKRLDHRYKYIFTDNRIFAGTVGEEPDKMEQYGYDRLRRVFEMRDAFYLDVRSDEYLILPKRDMDVKTEEKLRRVVAGKAKKQFMKCC